MFKEIVIASRNKGKLDEFKSIFSSLGVTIKSLDDYLEIADVVEDGHTFGENACKKAETISRLINLPVLADDSGLVVDALDGKPGIYSARYAGEEKDDRKNNEKLLNSLEGVDLKRRTARYICALALSVPKSNTIIIKGTCEGLIGLEAKGSNGFGYDPLFYLPDYNQTMAEISPKLKNIISHRAVALNEMVAVLKRKL
ncbi:MAG: XTP/dITP diphosphatase [Vulcanibacillus sp.]